MNLMALSILFVTILQATDDEPVPQTSWVGPVLFVVLLLSIVIYVIRRNSRK